MATHVLPSWQIIQQLRFSSHTHVHHMITALQQQAMISIVDLTSVENFHITSESMLSYDVCSRVHLPVVMHKREVSSYVHPFMNQA